MKISLRSSKIIAGIVIIMTAACEPAAAQWLNYPTAGIPRAPDGRPNLTAQAARASDGKPDLSGMWGWEDNRPCPADGCADAQVGQEFINIGWSLKDGLPYQPWAAALMKQRR